MSQSAAGLLPCVSRTHQEVEPVGPVQVSLNVSQPVGCHSSHTAVFGVRPPSGTSPFPVRACRSLLRVIRNTPVQSTALLYSVTPGASWEMSSMPHPHRLYGGDQLLGSRDSFYSLVTGQSETASFNSMKLVSACWTK